MNLRNLIRFDNDEGRWTTHYGITASVERLLETDRMMGYSNVEYHKFEDNNHRQRILQNLISQYQMMHNIRH